MEELENVQRRTAKMIQGYKDLSYKEKLKRCGLTTLETWRSRGDLIEAYKIINGKEAIGVNPGGFGVSRPPDFGLGGYGEGRRGIVGRSREITIT